MKYLWYASYGSNISENRFLCYIQGGKPKGSNRTYQGCVDRTPPRDSGKIKLNSELYFAKESKSWTGGGVCFIKTQISHQTSTLGKLYLISEAQFVDVLKQECDYEGPIDINFQQIAENKSFIFNRDAWYGHIMFIGSRDGFPIFTFTNATDLTSEINPPDEHYLNTIANGLRESHKLAEPEILGYLKKQTGIRGYHIESRLPDIVSKRV